MKYRVRMLLELKSHSATQNIVGDMMEYQLEDMR